MLIQSLNNKNIPSMVNLKDHRGKINNESSIALRDSVPQ